METYNSSYTAEQLEYALGAVPSIGENGNWYIGETDTGIYAGGIKVTGAEVGQTVKIAAVNENGIPTAWEAVDGLSDWELVGSYIHSGNDVIQPDALDITTGVFTVNAGHGLTTGDLLCAFMNDPTLWMDYNTKTKVPMNTFNHGSNALVVTVIDDHTFTLAAANGTSISYTDCTAVDCSLFRFEQRSFNTKLCEFVNLSDYNDIRIVSYGNAACEIKTTFKFTESGMLINQNVDFNRTGAGATVSVGSNAFYKTNGTSYSMTTSGVGAIYMHGDIMISRFGGKACVEGITRADYPTTDYAGRGRISSIRTILPGIITGVAIEMYYRSFVANGFKVEVFAK